MSLAVHRKVKRLRKIILIFPILPIVDLLSTFFAFSYGATEGGPWAKLIFDLFGSVGLIFYAVMLSLILFVMTKWLCKNITSEEKTIKLQRVLMLFAVFACFVGEGYWALIIVQNFLFPLSLSFEAVAAIRFLVPLTYIIGAAFFAKEEIRLLWLKAWRK